MRKILDRSYDYLFGALLLIIPFGNAIPNIVIALIIIGFVINYKQVNFKRLKAFPFVLFYLFLSYIFIKAAITQSLFTEWKIYKKFLILFILPILFLKIRQTSIVKAGGIAGVIISIVVSGFLTAKYYMQFGSLPFTSGEEVNTLLLLERPYMGFYAVMGTIFSFDLIKHYPNYKKWFIASGIVSVAYVILISARISFLTLIIVAGIYILFYLGISKIKKTGLIAISIITVVLTIMINKNIAERFFIKANLEETIRASDYEPRLVIWPCAYSLIQQKDFNTLFGYPCNSIVVNRLVDCYSHTIVDNDSKKAYFVETKFNSHNQFIDIYLSYGFIGLLLFTAFFVALFLKVRYSFFDSALIIAMLLFLLVENVLHRQTGCYIFSIFAALLLIRNNLVNEKD